MFGVKPIEYGKQTGAVAAANFLTSPYVGVHNLQRALMGMHKTGPKISGTTMVKAVLRNSSLTVANSVAAVSRNTSAFVGGKVPAAYANNTYGAELKTIFGNNTLCQNIATRSLTGLPFSMTLGYYLDLVTNKHTGLIYDELMVLGPNKMTTTKLNPETPITLGRAIDLANKEVRGAISERRLPQGYWARVLHNNLGIAITMGVMDWGIKYLSRSSSDDGLNP